MTMDKTVFFERITTELDTIGPYAGVDNALGEPHLTVLKGIMAERYEILVSGFEGEGTGASALLILMGEEQQLSQSLSSNGAQEGFAAARILDVKRLFLGRALNEFMTLKTAELGIPVGDEASLAAGRGGSRGK